MGADALTVTSHPCLFVSGTSLPLNHLVNCPNSLTAPLPFHLPSILSCSGRLRNLTGAPLHGQIILNSSILKVSVYNLISNKCVYFGFGDKCQKSGEYEKFLK